MRALSAGSGAQGASCLHGLFRGAARAALSFPYAKCPCCADVRGGGFAYRSEFQEAACEHVGECVCVCARALTHTHVNVQLPAQWAPCRFSVFRECSSCGFVVLK